MVYDIYVITLVHSVLQLRAKLSVSNEQENQDSKPGRGTIYSHSYIEIDFRTTPPPIR
jgi:hypothetical protein